LAERTAGPGQAPWPLLGRAGRRALMNPARSPGIPAAPAAAGARVSWVTYNSGHDGRFRWGRTRRARRRPVLGRGGGGTPTNDVVITPQRAGPEAGDHLSGSDPLESAGETLDSAVHDGRAGEIPCRRGPRIARGEATGADALRRLMERAHAAEQGGRSGATRGLHAIAGVPARTPPRQRAHLAPGR